jgi:hypothetical protein
MQKKDLFELTTFVDSETFDRIANGEQNEVLRVLYPSNRDVFIIDEDGDNVNCVDYDAMRIVDIVRNLELHCEIKNVNLISLTADDGKVYPYVIRGKEYIPEGIVYELGNVLTVEEDETDK